VPDLWQGTLSVAPKSRLASAFSLYTSRPLSLSNQAALTGERPVRIGFFGGSFDPPHICHLLFCVWALEMADIDKVLWVPCVRHPFGKDNAPYEDRLAMCRLAAQSMGDRVEVSAIESELPQPSYTVNTMRALREQWPGDDFAVLIGSDLVNDLDDWQRIEELRAMADFVVVPRGGYAEGKDKLHIALPALSSTDVREALRQGGSAESVVPARVIEYIQKKRLYQT
jgi:nicotinate-nucleotide adenylyltransferase